MNSCLARGVNKFTIEHPLTTVREAKAFKKYFPVSLSHCSL
jgi:hypothetical protein